jgi:hypothetical protein
MAEGRTSVAVVLAAGAAGGAAEVLWIVLAAALLGTDASLVARGITATFSLDPTAARFAPALGLLIHLALSIALAAVFVQTIGRRLRGAALWSTALALLALVWAFNFLLLLPLINPALVELLPHPVTLISKLLFGAAMASVLVATAPVR